LLRSTTFANVDLSTVIGQDTVYHLGPSTIGLDTVSRSKGNIAEAFLRGAKVHENLLTSIREQGKTPFDYFTSFISYASEDLVFAEGLRDALQREGVWCWFAPYSLRGGDYFRARIDSAIRQCDKLLAFFVASLLTPLPSRWTAINLSLMACHYSFTSKGDVRYWSLAWLSIMSLSNFLIRRRNPGGLLTLKVGPGHQRGCFFWPNECS
jgi:hypothetical protein